MPNRIIKESICKSEDIDGLSYFEEVLFYRLIVNCDDYGRFDGREKIINSFCFPLKDIKDTEITKALAKLSAAGMIKQYFVDGKKYIQLTSWENHQQIRSKKSKYPALDDGCEEVITDDITCNQMISDDSKCPRNPIQSESNPNPNPNPNRKRAQEDQIRESELSDPVKDKLIEWVEYKRQKKQTYVEKGLASLITQVAKAEQQHGSTQVMDLMDQCMANGYAGIIFDRLDKQPTARSGTTRPSEIDMLFATAREMEERYAQN